MTGETGFNTQALVFGDTVIQETAAAIETRDFDRFAPFFALPYTISVGQKQTVLNTQDDLHQSFRSVCDLYHGQGMNRVHRRLTTALFDGPDTIHLTHMTTLMKDDQPLRGPYSSYVTLKFQSSCWKVISSHFASDAHAAPDDVAYAPSNRQDEMAAIEGNALFALFQSSLNRFTAAMQHGTIEDVMETIQTPFFVQGCDGAEVVQTHDDLSRVFQQYRTGLTVRGVTDIVRLVKQADLVGDRRINGTFRTHVLAGSQLVMPAYTSTLTLEQSDDLHWQVTSFMMPFEQRLKQPAGPAH